MPETTGAGRCALCGAMAGLYPQFRADRTPLTLTLVECEECGPYLVTAAAQRLLLGSPTLAATFRAELLEQRAEAGESKPYAQLFLIDRRSVVRAPSTLAKGSAG